MSVSFNDALRVAAGHQALDVPVDQHEHAGDVGIGRGNACGPPRVRDDVALMFGREIRASAGIVRGFYRAADLIGNA